MLEIEDLANYCDDLLDIASFNDYCPNGLQVAGTRPIARLVSGVTASQALIDAALEWGADALLVHHGFFWKGEDPRLIGYKGRRIGSIMRGGMSMFAYHLPLDAHPELGNNRQLARVLGIDAPEPVPGGLLWRGRLAARIEPDALADLVGTALARKALYVRGHDRLLENLAWCSGGAQREIEQAARLGVDAYLSGEISEQTTHLARELGIDYIAAGHHASERYGAEALGEHLAVRFGLEHKFVDVPNPA